MPDGRQYQRCPGTLSTIEAFRNSKDASTLTVLMEDSAALLGVVIALAGVAGAQLLEQPRLDAIASIGIGLVLLMVCGEIDLSVGFVWTLSPYVMHFFVDSGIPTFIAIVITILILAVVIGTVESVMARLRLVRIPQLLVAASILTAFSLVLVLR